MRAFTDACSVRVTCMYRKGPVFARQNHSSMVPGTIDLLNRYPFLLAYDSKKNKNSLYG